MTKAESAIEVRTLGCKVNFADMQALAGALSEDADGGSILVGTCCVTAEGEKQSRKEVRRALKAAGPGGTVYVAGCSARLHPEEYQSMGENVRLLVEADARARAGVHAVSKGNSSKKESAVVSTDRTRFFLKVQDGCANMCSYCVIPGVRGRPVSLTARDVIDTAKRAIASGFPELVVTGINTGGYQDGGLSLAGLIDELAALPGLKRLRLSSIEAMHVDDGLLDVFERHPLIGRHLHLPLQSGDAGVLKAMGRRYDPAAFLAIVERIRSRVPEINLTTDVIAGFPGEDEAAHARTMAFIEEAGFSKAHVFVYSPRPGTKAAGLGDPVPPPVKKRRAAGLRALSDRLQTAYRQRKLGRLDEILLESPAGSEEHGGYSSDYTRFLVPGGRPGDIVCVRGELVKSDGIWGKICQEMMP